MKFEIYKTSEYYERKNSPCKKAYKEGNSWYIDIETIEDLACLTKEVKELLILGIGNSEGDNSLIEIYDCLREEDCHNVR